jgi:hypothetical protein
LLVHEPVVDAVIRDHLPDLSRRSIQRRFLRATGLTYLASSSSHAPAFAISAWRSGRWWRLPGRCPVKRI